MVPSLVQNIIGNTDSVSYSLRKAHVNCRCFGWAPLINDPKILLYRNEQTLGLEP